MRRLRIFQFSTGGGSLVPISSLALPPTPSPHSPLSPPPHISPGSLTKTCPMRRRFLLQVINANNLIIGTTSQPAAIGAKPNRMNRPTVIAHMAQLFRTRVFCIRRIANSLHAPDTHMAISRRRRDTAPIRRDVAGVDLEILLLAWSSVSIHSALYWGQHQHQGKRC